MTFGIENLQGDNKAELGKVNQRSVNQVEMYRMGPRT